MMNFEGIQDLGGASAQNETQAPEEKVVNLEEQKKKRQPFAYWNVGGRSFKMKLKASGIGRLENKYRQNLMNMIDDIPPLSVMLTIIQEAMSPWEHGNDRNRS